MALADKIKDLSSSNPLVLQAIHQMEKKHLLFDRSKAEDWIFDDGHLYFKTHFYIPEVACHDLVATTHHSVMAAICKSLYSSPRIIGGPVFPPTSGNTSLDVQSAKHTRCSPILQSQPSPPLPLRGLALFKTSLWTSSLPFPPSMILTLSWSWLTMALVRG